MTKKFSTRFLATAIFCLFLGIGQIFAQAGTGNITGVVTDANGAVVPNATVNLVNTKTNFQQTTTASNDGIYSFRTLQPGVYSVTASAANFSEQKLEVEVQVGRTTDANVTLGVSGLEAQVTVSAEGVQTTESNFDAVQDQTAIENLPINGRRFQDFVTLTPNAQVGQGGDTRGQISLSGQRGINSNINVDGVDYNQPFFGGIRGGERSNLAFTIPQESIREFQVVAAGYSAEFGRSSGGIVNGVTKSGTNELRGSLFYLYRPEQLAIANEYAQALEEQRLSSLNLDATLAPTQQQFGGSIGGPIIRDRLFYFASYEQQRFRAPRQILYGNLVGFTPTAAQTEAFNFFRSLETPFEQTNDAYALLGKIDWNINNSNRFNIRYNYSFNDALNAVATGETSLDPTTNRSLATNGSEQNRNNVVVAQLITNISSNVLNELRFQHAREERPRIANENISNLTTSIGEFGTRSFLPTTQSDVRNQIIDSVTFISGNHTFKFGGEFSNIDAQQQFGFNQFGLYTFSGLTGTAGILDALSKTPAATRLGRFDVSQARYRQQIGNLQADLRVQELAFFAQDQWRITPRLTFNYGLRYEKQFNPEAEANNEPVLNLIRNTNFPILGGKGVDPAQIPDSQDQWGPRVGFAYDPKGDGKTVFRAFSGIYYARTPLIVLAAPFNNFRDPAGDLSVELGPGAFSSAGFNQAAFEAANPQYVAIVGPGQAPNTVFRQFAILGINLNNVALNQLPTLSPTQLQGISTAIRNATTNPPANLGVFQNAQLIGISPEFKNPQSFQFGGGVEHEIMNGVVLGLDFVQVNTVNLQRNRDINIPSALSPTQYIAFLQANNTAANFAALQTATNNFADILSTNRQIIGIFAPTSIPTNIRTNNVNAVVTRPRPISSLGSIQLRESSARSLYRGLTFRVRVNKRWGQISAFYTLSKNSSDDDNERDSGGVLYDNPYDLSGEYGPSRIDRRHNFVANPVVFLPFGFEVSSAIRLRSGAPINATVGADLNGDGNNNERPFLLPGRQLKRNAFEGAPIYDVDLRLQKGFTFGETRRLVFSADFFNIFNVSNVQLTSTTSSRFCSSANPRCGLDGITNVNFSQVRERNPNSALFDQIIVANNPGSQVFQVQFGARFNF